MTKNPSPNPQGNFCEQNSNQSWMKQSSHMPGMRFSNKANTATLLYYSHNPAQICSFCSSAALHLSVQQKVTWAHDSCCCLYFKTISIIRRLGVVFLAHVHAILRQFVVNKRTRGEKNFMKIFETLFEETSRFSHLGLFYVFINNTPDLSIFMEELKLRRLSYFEIILKLTEKCLYLERGMSVKRLSRWLTCVL